MRVKAVRRFYDGWEKRVRVAGEVFETTQERYEYWNSASLVCVMEEEKPVADSDAETAVPPIDGMDKGDRSRVSGRGRRR